MTSCRTIQKRLGPYLDKEALEWEQDLINDHLAVCPHCRQDFERLENLAKGLRAVEVPPCPISLGPRIMDQARNHSFSQGLITRIMGLGMPQWAACTALACGLVIGSLMGLSTTGAMGSAPACHAVEIHCDNALFLCGIHGLYPLDPGGIDSLTLKMMEN